MSVSKVSPIISNTINDFDFLTALAKNDPEAFEKIREKIIQEFINASDGEQRQRLIRFQWRINQTRLQAKNPLHAVVKLNQMMWGSIEKLSQNQLLDCFQGHKPAVENNFTLINISEYKNQRNQ